MVEHTCTPAQYEEITKLAVEDNSTTAVPMTLAGEALPDVSRQFVSGSYKSESDATRDRIHNTAMQSYALSVGDAELYARHTPDRPVVEAPAAPFAFSPKLDALPDRDVVDRSHLEADTQATLDLLEQYVQLFDGKTQNKPLYSPYVDPAQADRQLVVTEQVKAVRDAIARDIEALKQGEPTAALKIEQPVTAIALQSLTRAHLLPTSLPVNTTAGDFDSGNCDVGLTTSLGRGDRVAVRARYGEHVFVSNAPMAGWVKESDVVVVTDEDKQQLDAQGKERFYKEGQPHFYKNGVLFPGDVVYERDGRVAVLEKDEQGKARLQELSDLATTALTEGITTPQEFVDFLSRLNLPYMWANFDCSEVFRRAERMQGKRVRKYSGSIAEDLIEAGLEQQAATKEGLPELADGIYAVNLQRPGSDGTYSSTHFYVDTVNGGEHTVFSYAFNILGDDGTVETPVGPHTAGKAALEQQVKKGRQVIFIKMTE